MTKSDAEITVASLVKWLSTFRPDQRVIFGLKDLRFRTVKEADDYIVIEFEQSLHRDSAGQIIVVDHNMP